MRAFLVIVALFAADGVLSKAVPSGAEQPNFNNCLKKHHITRGSVPPMAYSEEQRDCLFGCFMQRVNWIKPDGTYNFESLNEQNNEMKKDEALAIIDLCNEEANDHNDETTCIFAGCLRRNRIATAYS